MLRAYGSGFLIFSDYMRPAIRLSAIMELPTLWIFTHNSIGVGEDGPTHQPVEQLISLRAVPGLITMRPGDANEVAEAWRALLQMKKQPVCLVLSRQPLPTLDRQRYAAGRGSGPRRLRAGRPARWRGARGHPDRHGQRGLALRAGLRGADRPGREGRVVSMPSSELFERQDESYRARVLPAEVTARVAVEQATTIGWERYVGLTGAKIGMHSFGASAPLKELLGKFGFTPEKVCRSRARSDRPRPGRKGQVMNPLQQLGEVGQSVWLDNVSRGLIRKGELATLIQRDGLKGVTSNPSIFEKAIGGSGDYDSDLVAFARSTNADAMAVYEHLAVGDIQEAADVLRPVFDATGGRDGFISLEVSPYLALDTRGDRGRGAAPVGGGRPAEPDDQGAGHGGWGTGHRHPDRRRPQHQRHAAVLAVLLRGGRPGLYRGPGNAGRGGTGRRRGRTAWPASSSAASTARSMRIIDERLKSAGGEERAGSGAGSRQGRDRQREAGLSALARRFSRGPRWETVGAQGCGRAAAALGLAPAPRTRPTAMCSTSRS